MDTHSLIITPNQTVTAGTVIPAVKAATTTVVIMQNLLVTIITGPLIQRMNTTLIRILIRPLMVLTPMPQQDIMRGLTIQTLQLQPLTPLPFIQEVRVARVARVEQEE